MRELLRKNNVRIWLAVVGSATLLLGTAYVMVQQSTRLSANDAPAKLSQQIKSQLESDNLATDLSLGNKINIDKDYNDFVIVTDSSRHVLASSASLDGQTPLPPEGVFKFTAAHGNDKVSWEPKTGVRSAIYVSTYGVSPNDGYVIAGHSLKPYEDRITVYGYLALAGWLAILAWTSCILIIPAIKK